MATKRCVACAEEIQPNAKLCKHCGVMQNDARFLGDAPSSKPTTSEARTQISNSRRGLLIGALVLAVATAGYFAVQNFTFSGGAQVSQPQLSETPQPVPLTKEQQRQQATAELKDALAATKLKIRSLGATETLVYESGETYWTYYSPAFTHPRGRVAYTDGNGAWQNGSDADPLESNLSWGFITYIDTEYSSQTYWNHIEKISENQYSLPVQWADAKPVYVFTVVEGIITSVDITGLRKSGNARATYEFSVDEAGMNVLKDAQPTEPVYD
ncbi:MAG: hypothetical protein RLZZ319_635 [Actinomycetota bacterium]